MGLMNKGFPDLLRAYRLYQKMMRYPELIEEMRSIFLAVLQERGICDKAALLEEARQIPAANGAAGEPADQGDVDAYVDALVDLTFAKHLTEAETENYINLARKKARFRELYKVVNREDATSQKIKKALKDFCAIPEGDVYISPNEAEGVRVALIDYFISNQLPVISTAKRHVTIRDIDELLDHAYWDRRFPGKIGGKAAGMVIAHKVLLPRLLERDPELEKYVRIPESYYFNSGVFMDFIDYNGLHQFHSQKYKTREEIEEDYKHLSKLFRESSFPPDVIKDFRGFLSKIGEHPLILRSSSLLEDNYGHAFSGKYDSVFLANQGDLETRLKEFIWGMNRVHMSTYGPSPILYRRDHKLLDFDEKMSALVQKVVGRRIGDYFFPLAAGVAFSYSSYNWTPRIRREDGVVRLVMGLGTRAVDRVGSDYPRMIPLSHPTLRSEIGADQIWKYSQKMVDVLNLKTRALESLPFSDVAGRMPSQDISQVVSLRQEGQLSPPMFKTQRIDIDRSCVTFDNFIRKSPFVPLIKKILRKLEEAYGYPVDVEFAWHEGKFYLLQCRSLTISREEGTVSLPAGIRAEDVLFENTQVLTSGLLKDIEYAVYVDPKAYARIDSFEGKIQIARAVSRINRLLEGKRYALFGPGRWGSNDINLGVKVAYEDINHTLVLGEIAFEESGSTPEVSYGTHFFNDLVEARIIPIALFPDRNGNLLRDDYLVKAENQIRHMAPEYASCDHVVHVIHIPRSFQGRYLYVYQDGRGQKGIGFLDHPSEKNS
jgi:hypothetical protein